MRYPEPFKTEMIRKMMPPFSVAANRLARETGVSQATLSRWYREAGKLAAMETDENSKPSSEWTAAEKLAAVVESAPLKGEHLGSYLRRKGLHRADLDRWRRQMLGGLETQPKRSSGSRNAPEKRKIRSLERELKRKDAALAETAALLVLSKKVNALWGDEDGATTRKREKKSSDGSKKR